jgi:hypothetical protein
MFAGVMSILVVLVVGTTTGRAPAHTFPTGQLLQDVASSSTPGQRFAIYVPRSYDPSHAAPIIYVMDPRGRARVAASLFQSAAERYGYILFSSYNTESDGAPEITLRALQAMWNDSHDWLRLDDRRVYLAGFSGTARLATLIARNRREAIAGVIGAAAGFHPNVKPDRKTLFLYFATVGDEDYNFHEIETLERSLVSLDVPHRIERFAGPHSWMSAPLAARAIEWLELRAMQSGLRSRDAALIDAWWRRDQEAATAATSDGRILDAARLYAAMARDFAGLRDTAAVKTLAARTTATAEARSQRSRRQSEAQKSREWGKTLMSTIAESYPDDATVARRSPVELAQELDVPALEQAAARPSAEAAKEAKRRLNEMEVQLGFYLPAEALASGSPARARYYLSTALLINQRSPVTWYLLSQVHAHLNARRDALDALRRAIDAGFRDAALLESDPAFRPFRADTEFTALVQDLRSSGDQLDLLTVDRPPPRQCADALSMPNAQC